LLAIVAVASVVPAYRTPANSTSLPCRQILLSRPKLQLYP
jgi:hypothetical protein